MALRLLYLILVLLDVTGGLVVEEAVMCLGAVRIDPSGHLGRPLTARGRAELRIRTRKRPGKVGDPLVEEVLTASSASGLVNIDRSRALISGGGSPSSQARTRRAAPRIRSAAAARRAARDFFSTAPLKAPRPRRR
ncbi:hypothetical protein AB0E59_32210 [Lentzea sp. NPDC034063]|uniref:hypothetical protein n=1 Tax=Lentzea sp. NPDC034063 TaxID=3154912 RepID=UPI0033DDDEBD